MSQEPKLVVCVIIRHTSNEAGDPAEYVEDIALTLEGAHLHLDNKYPRGWFNFDTQDTQQGEDEFWEEVVERLSPMFSFNDRRVVMR